jgi:hypothetical protein
MIWYIIIIFSMFIVVCMTVHLGFQDNSLHTNDTGVME